MLPTRESSVLRRENAAFICSFFKRAKGDKYCLRRKQNVLLQQNKDIINYYNIIKNICVAPPPNLKLFRFYLPIE